MLAVISLVESGQYPAKDFVEGVSANASSREGRRPSISARCPGRLNETWDCLDPFRIVDHPYNGHETLDDVHNVVNEGNHLIEMLLFEVEQFDRELRKVAGGVAVIM